MAPVRPTWLKATGLGCLGLLAVVVLVLGASYVLVQVANTRDIASLERLAREQPGPGTYTPPATAIAADRLHRFLEVRGLLARDCPELTSAVTAFAAMDSLSGRGDDPSTGELLGKVGQATRGLLTVARRAGGHLATRNRALLAAGMGLGEFTWIQVLAYHGWLGLPPTRFVLARQDEPRVFQDRVVPQVRRMMRRLVAARERAGADPAELAPWRRELAALDADPERVPFADGVPPGLAASLEPFRGDLEASWCQATCEVDLTVTEREGIGFEHR